MTDETTIIPDTTAFREGVRVLGTTLERRSRLSAVMGTDLFDVTVFSYGYLRGTVEATLAGAPLELLREALEDLTVIRREKGLRQ